MGQAFSFTKNNLGDILTQGVGRSVVLKIHRLYRLMSVILLLLVLYAGCSMAEQDFRDIPSRHWAGDSVNDLVKLGITQGYPDGTFRGSNNISRYETAMFMAKLSEAVSGPTGDVDMAIEQLKKDLRAEIRELRAEIAQLKKRPEEIEERPISGSYMTRMMFGNLLTGNTATPGIVGPVGPKVNYRLKTTFAKSLGQGANVKVNVDTMDAGFNGGQGDLSTKILDIEGNMKVSMGFESPVDVKVTVGPGTVIHTEEADSNGNYIARSENNFVYERPYNGISFSTKFGAIDTLFGYFARKMANTGEIDVNQFKLLGKWYIPMLFIADEVNLYAGLDYLTRQPQSTPPGPSDTKITLGFDALGGKNIKYDLVFGFGQGSDGMMGGLGVTLQDIWETGTIISFKYKAVGSTFLYEPAQLDEYLFAGTDNFGRLVLAASGEGVVDVGLEVTQVLSETINLVSRTDMRLAPGHVYDSAHAQCALTTELGLVYDVAPNTILQGLYRVETIPSAADQTTDLLQMVLSFTF